MKNCPLCNNELSNYNSFFVCKKRTNRGLVEFYQNDKYIAIRDDFYEINYSFQENNTFFYDGSIRFILKSKFKIRNSSVTETYLHYHEMRLFS